MNENFKPHHLELSHPVEVKHIPTQGLRVALEANDLELSLLMARFDLLALGGLKTVLAVKPLAGGPKMRVTGHMVADVTQACIVNLSPVKSHIDEAFQVDFAPPRYIEMDVELSLEDDDSCEPIEGGVIDLGELAAQQLGLSINPYPRSETADLAVFQQETQGKSGPAFAIADKPNPFAVLANLKNKQDSDGKS